MIRFVLCFNFLFFSMSYGDFNLKMGTLLIGGLFVHHYNYGMAPLARTQVNEQAVDQAGLDRMKRRWSIYSAGYSLAAPLLMVVHKIVLSIGIGNIWNSMLAAGTGAVTGMVLDILPRSMNIPRHGGALLTYTRTIHFCISLSMGGYLKFHVWKGQPTDSSLSWRESCFFVALHCVAGISSMPAAIEVERRICRSAQVLFVYLRNTAVFALGMLLIFALALGLSSKGWQWGFDDVKGTTMTTSIFVIVWYTLYNFLPKLLPDVV
jgi:hypothetical protein